MGGTRGTAVQTGALYEQSERIGLRSMARGEESSMKNERVASGVAMAVALTLGVSLAAGAQDIEIRDDGSNVSHSAAGASNVRMERNGGRETALSGDGQGNQEIRRGGRNDREDRTRTHGQNKDNGDSYGGNSGAAGDSYAGGDSYGGGMSAYVDPAAAGWQPEPVPDAAGYTPAPVAAAAPAAIPAGGSPTNPVLLPRTGSPVFDPAGLVAALGSGAVVSAMFGLRRRS
jgi:hypothetical protein